VPSRPGQADRGRRARGGTAPAGDHDRGGAPAGATYAAAGVDIEAGERAVDAIRDLVRSTSRPEVLGDIGGFGGLFSVPRGYRDPVLVAATDGVGTKLAVAQAMGNCRTIGIDLVAMCVDDLVCQGAEPLFFLDYLSTGKVDPGQVRDILEGIAEGCRQAGCAILGGEMAEHPGLLAPGEFDVAGFAVGIVDRDRVLTPERVAPGDVLIGLPSPGLRSNGYSLARRVLLDLAGRSLHEPAFTTATGATTSVPTLGEELLRPSVIYAPAVLAVLRDQGPARVDIHGVAHITGGGLPGNVPRCLPRDFHAVLHRRAWEVPPIFGVIQAAGRIADDEMARVFNLGVGMVVVVPHGQATAAVDALSAAGQPFATVIGEVVTGAGPVTFED
jgi:phosphoribosylformylglycinamidine cyclo-ligase